ncbi:hypothetical protein [Burkholderia oklahomensis]|uniref:hypothetical protein n=1 Tax=Burkholderia oklahomensis TaxID=342113 RepID=UPI0005D94DD5|nr:hypothetical protein [Burkholderia oklahomensis]AJX35649.1 hypothetical protein BG90_4128 [Burkholderia oklahomensis C6786]MBI0363968.1 hypothetical protein [Burkholderia oklahomensis]SUY28166.1 Uncharacterised protein [Burkholderia oklahomensis]
MPALTSHEGFRRRERTTPIALDRCVVAAIQAKLIDGSSRLRIASPPDGALRRAFLAPAGSSRGVACARLDRWPDNPKGKSESIGVVISAAVRSETTMHRLHMLPSPEAPRKFGQHQLIKFDTPSSLTIAASITLGDLSYFSPLATHSTLLAPTTKHLKFPSLRKYGLQNIDIVKLNNIQIDYIFLFRDASEQNTLKIYQSSIRIPDFVSHAQINAPICQEN